MTTDPPEDFKIVLTPSPEGVLVYNPGSEVTGTLYVKVNNPRKYSDIVINLHGVGYVRWTKTTVHITPSNGISNFYTTVAVREAEKLYVDLTKTLWSKSEALDGNLSPGVHTFPFHFVLPPGIPSSHKSKVKIPAQVGDDYGNGWTRYTLCGRIRRECPHSNDHVTEIHLTVKEIININIPRLLLPVNMHVCKTAGFVCCLSGSVTTTLALPKTGFCIGEDICYHITVVNGQRHAVEATASLEEHITYHTRFRKCFPKVILHGSVNNGPVQPGQTTTLTPEVQVLKIPTSVIATANSNIIKQSFMLKVKVRIPRVIFNPVLICPLIISNMPYRQGEPILPSVAVGHVNVMPSFNASARPPGDNYSVPAPSNISIPLDIPVQNSQAGGSGASALSSAEPPSYQDTIKKY